MCRRGGYESGVNEWQGRDVVGSWKRECGCGCLVLGNWAGVLRKREEAGPGQALAKGVEWNCKRRWRV